MDALTGLKIILSLVTYMVGVFLLFAVPVAISAKLVKWFADKVTSWNW